MAVQDWDKEDLKKCQGHIVRLFMLHVHYRFVSCVSAAVDRSYKTVPGQQTLQRWKEFNFPHFFLNCVKAFKFAQKLMDCTFIALYVSLSFTYSHTHSYINLGCCYARRCLAHWQQFRVLPKATKD